MKAWRKKKATRKHWKQLAVNMCPECPACGVKFDEDAHAPSIDHVIPLSRGGSDCEDNWQLLCKTCNGRKGSNLPSEWKPQENIVRVSGVTRSQYS